MAFSSLGANDWVTNNNAQDAVTNGFLFLRSGETIPANNDWMTKSEAYTKLQIDAISGTGTDWITKSQFVSSLTFYGINDNGCILALSPDLVYTCVVLGNNYGAVTYGNIYLFVLHSGPVQIGDILYARHNFVSPPSYYIPDNLNNSYFAFRNSDGNPIGVTIGSNTEITSIVDCTIYYYKINSLISDWSTDWTKNDSCANISSNIFSTEYIYITRSTGVPEVGDILYYYDTTTKEYTQIDMLYPQPPADDPPIPHQEYIAYYDNVGALKYIKNSNFYSEVEEIGDCTIDNILTVNFYYSPGTGSYSYDIYATYPVTSTIQIDVEVYNDLSGYLGIFPIYIYAGNSFDSGSGYAGGNPSGYGSWGIVSYSPSSDSTYNYLL